MQQASRWGPNVARKHTVLYFNTYSLESPEKVYKFKKRTHFHVSMALHLICSTADNYNYIYIYIYIQGVPGGKDLTSGECSLGQTILI